jgi:hypothetical protein
LNNKQGRPLAVLASVIGPFHSPPLSSGGKPAAEFEDEDEDEDAAAEFAFFFEDLAVEEEVVVDDDAVDKLRRLQGCWL